MHFLAIMSYHELSTSSGAHVLISVEYNGRVIVCHEVCNMLYRYFWTIFQSCCANVYIHQQRVKLLAALYPCLHLVLLVKIKKKNFFLVASNDFWYVIFTAILLKIIPYILQLSSVTCFFSLLMGLFFVLFG